MSASSASGFAYRAFISYSHRDKAWADWLHKALETYRVPSRLVGTQTAHGEIPRRLNPIFRDREELSSSPELGTKINQALAQSENLIVLCSPGSATSRWVNEEVLAYKRMGRAGRIFCVIVDGEPNATDLPGRASEECFCPALRFVPDANGQPTPERTEPIAADARPGKDGKQNAKLKLIAGMLDVGFDALKQREQQRRIRRMTAITALAVCVMAVTIVLAILALVSRHRAVIAQHEAVVAQQAAQRRQKQAEGLVNFMLGDLNDKLAQVQRLDIMQAVDDKAMAYFQSLPNTDVTPEALAQRAKALEKIGVVRMGQGRLPGALAAFRASIKISSRLAAEKPVDVVRQVAYARTLSYIGFTYWHQDSLVEAQQNFQRAKAVLQRARTSGHEDPSAEFELALVTNNIGHVLEARGQFAPATAAYRNMLALMRELVLAAPGNADYLPYLGNAYNNLGKMALLRGDLAESITKYRTDDAIETRLSARNPKDNNRRENVLRVHAILGRTLALTGDTAMGMRDLQRSVDMATILNRFEPNETDVQDSLALYSSQLARLQRLCGDFSAAQVSTARSITILSELTRKGGGDSDWQSDLAKALSEQAAEAYERGARDAARKQAQAAIGILDPMLDKQPDQRDLLLAVATAKLLLASVTANAKVAKALRMQSLQATRAVRVNAGDPRLLALEVRALLELDRDGEARPLIDRLWHEGYREAEFVELLKRNQIAYPVNDAFARKIATIMKTAPSGVALQKNPANVFKLSTTHR